MAFGDSVKKLIGIEDYDEEEITEEEIEKEKNKMEKERKAAAPKAAPPAERKRTPLPPSKPAPSPERRLSSMTTSGNFKLLLIEPKTFEECPKLVDSLKSRRPVIINLERLETETARKIFDFMSGATYALDGNVQKIANNIFVFAPENVDIAGGQQNEPSNFEFQEPKKEDESPWR